MRSPSPSGTSPREEKIGLHVFGRHPGAALSAEDHKPTREYFERLEEVERRHWWCRSVRRVALARLRAIPSDRPIVLDVGCGAGGFLSQVRRERPAARCFGADFSGDALALARSGLAVPLLRATAAALPIAPESADAVVLHDVLQHLPSGDDARALAEAHRVLRPGGVLSLRANIGPPAGTGSMSLHRRYDPATLARLVRVSGFEVEKHIVLHPVAALLGRIRRARPGPSPESHDLEHAGDLAVSLPGAFVNQAMDVYSRIEDAVIARLPTVIPIGDAQLLFARKPLRGGGT